MFLMHRTYFKKSLSLLWIPTCILLLSLPVWPETVEIESVPALSVSIDKNSVKVGDLLQLTLSYELPEGAELPESNGVRGLESLTAIEQKMQPGKIKVQFLVDQLESFELGPIGLTYIDTQGNQQQIETGPITITVLLIIFS